MAAIIAQMALANRERKKRQKWQKLYGMAANKSQVKLLPFDTHGFDPKKHNRYMKNKESIPAEKLNAIEAQYNQAKDYLTKFELDLLLNPDLAPDDKDFQQ